MLKVVKIILYPLYFVIQKIIDRISRQLSQNISHIINESSLNERIDLIEEHIEFCKKDFENQLINISDILIELRTNQCIVIENATKTATSDPGSIYDIHFEDWAVKKGFITNVINRETFLTTSWGIDTPYGEIINNAMLEAEYMFVKNLLTELKSTDGVICEFGVYKGRWLKKISDICEDIGFKTLIYGFDSFEGLPEPLDGLDISGFQKGQYSSDYKSVYEYLNCAKRDITLIQGWFSDTLNEPQAQSIKNIVFARIDCDLYQPALDCLKFLQSRLAEGSILVFDDWSWWFGHGEARAFFEWADNSGLKFEFLAINSWIHLYLRVHKK